MDLKPTMPFSTSTSRASHAEALIILLGDINETRNAVTRSGEQLAALARCVGLLW